MTDLDDDERPNRETVETDIGTTVVETPKHVTNPVTDRREDMTRLSEDGYCRKFIALEYASNSPDHVDLGSSPVLHFDKDRWELRELDGSYVLVKRDPESELDDLVLNDDVCTDGGQPTGTEHPGVTFLERVFAFNQQFDYGEYHEDPQFWVSMLAHQAEEAQEALDEGDEAHAYREAADAVLVAFQFMRSCGDASPHHYVQERIVNAEEKGIQDEIVPKYIDWYDGERDCSLSTGSSRSGGDGSDV